MPCPHNEITIVQRSQQQSAVAAAAYQSGEKLFCEYDQKVKHYPEKRGIVHNEILLPANAPRSYADRNTLWNAAEAVEKQWNSQLARRWVLTIPREIPPDQYAVLVREFCEQQFVSKGMIADFAIHEYFLRLPIALHDQFVCAHRDRVVGIFQHERSQHGILFYRHQRSATPSATGTAWACS